MVGFIDDPDDRHSVASIHSIASTVATTTSLASRMRDLNLDFSEGLGDTKDADRGAAQSPLAEESEEEHANGSARAADGPEEDLCLPHALHLLQRDPPLQVCCRLFERRSHPPLPLKRLSMAQVEDFRQHGYVVLDSLISREAAGRIKAEALRLSQRGLLQPVNPASMGIFSRGPAGISVVSCSSVLPPAPASSSPCSSCSSHTQLAGCSNGSTASHANGASNTADSQQQQQQQQRWGELRMPLVLGQPPADTATFAPVMAALQELQDDLSEFVRLRSRGGAEYSLCQLPPCSLAVPRHRDALPDDGRAGSASSSSSSAVAAAPSTSGSQPQQLQQANGAPAGQFGTPPGVQQHAGAAAGGDTGPCLSGQQQQLGQQQLGQQQLGQQQLGQQPGQQQPQQQQRRVSIFVFVNADWDRDAGGGLRLWPPQRPVGPSSATAASAAARRSPASSETGTTFSELSDCGSLRMPGPVFGSTTSSVIAEASAPDHDTYSLDGISLAESEAERLGLEWVEAEGGEMALDVAPLAGRVLLLLSGAVEHALLPGGGVGPSSDMVFLRAWCS